jgi:hypothetical protein
MLQAATGEGGFVSFAGFFSEAICVFLLGFREEWCDL